MATLHGAEQKVQAELISNEDLYLFNLLYLRFLLAKMINVTTIQ